MRAFPHPAAEYHPRPPSTDHIAIVDRLADGDTTTTRCPARRHDRREAVRPPARPPDRLLHISEALAGVSSCSTTTTCLQSSSTIARCPTNFSTPVQIDHVIAFCRNTRCHRGSGQPNL
jgi:hypothetical protein